MSSACECQAVNENVRWTCTDDFDQSKVAFPAAQRNCKQPTMTVGVFHPLGVRSLEISSCNARLTSRGLEERILQNYSIAEVTSLQKVAKLNQLNINGNKTSTIPKKALLVTQLQDVRLERNYICDITIKALKEAGASSPQWQRLLTVPATNLRTLRRLMYLDLAGNQIAELPPLTFHAFPHLVKLRLTKNKLMQLPANTFLSLPKVPSLGKLERLESLLDSNGIDRVESGAFANYPSLEMLNLADDAKLDWFLTYIATQKLQLRPATKTNEEGDLHRTREIRQPAVAHRGATHGGRTPFRVHASVGLSKGGGKQLLKLNSWLNTFLQALKGSQSSVGNTQSLAFVNSLLK